MKTKSVPNVTNFFNCLYSDTRLFGKCRTKPASRADSLKSVALFKKHRYARIARHCHLFLKFRRKLIKPKA